MIKFIPSRPAHPVDAPPLHPFQDLATWQAREDAALAIAKAEALAKAYGSRPPLPFGQGLSI